MPPKPFHPPRPTTSTKPSKSTTSKSKPNANLASKKRALEKKQKTQERSKQRESNGRARGRASNYGLPSLSPDTTQEPPPASSSSSENSSSDPNASPQQHSDLPTNVDSDPTENRTEILPPDLIQVLLQEFFTKPNTRVKKDARAAVGRYMETFVREGIARCVWARSEGEEGGEDGGGVGGFLEVEDLERVAPQLLMDF